jgi:glycosyltransferase involved in cell wall biosynthesis
MKLVVQIPCHNEEESLPRTLADLPRAVPGFDSVEWILVDDGSTDRSVEVARAHGIDDVVSLPGRRGLASAFLAGLEEALRRGADVIVNTDADNQYRAACIPALVAPILEGRAQIAVGARPIATIAHFSPLKKFLQRLGSWSVRVASGTDIVDATSGFRAYHKDAALQLYVINTYTYTLETIIQAGRKGIPITSVPIEVNGDLRPSRLLRGIGDYVRRSIVTILRISVIYRPLQFFTCLAGFVALFGAIGVLRFLYFVLIGESQGHIQSLVLSGALLAVAAIIQVGGFLADIVAANRNLLEDIRARQLRAEIERAGIGQEQIRPTITVR